MAELEGACKTADARVISTRPDVCEKDGERVPYDIHALASDDVEHSTDVRYTAKWALNAGSRIRICHGDGAADAGVESRCVKGWARPVDDMSRTVLINGKRTVRHDTVFDMNCKGPEGPANTSGRMSLLPLARSLVMRGPALYTPGFDEARKKTLAELEERFDEADFYETVGDFDELNQDVWNEMIAVQDQFHAAESLYGNAETIAYSQSVRQTLHGAVINLFRDPQALVTVLQAPGGLPTWYTRMHGTTFRANGAWNVDFLDNGLAVGGATPSSMYKNLPLLAEGMDEEDPYAAHAAETVREMRECSGLQVSRRPGEPRQE